jgi:predicted nucleic acid-binding protein
MSTRYRIIRRYPLSRSPRWRRECLRLMALNPGARRLRTLDLATSMHCFDINETAASQWARMRVRLVEERLRANVNDLWIAAVAIANDLPVVTQDDDFVPLKKLVGLSVIRV